MVGQSFRVRYAGPAKHKRASDLNLVKTSLYSIRVELKGFRVIVLDDVALSTSRDLPWKKITVTNQASLC